MAAAALVVGILALIVSLTFNILQARWRTQQKRNEQAPPNFYNFDGRPSPITLSGIQHAAQGPLMDVSGAVTIGNPTPSHMKISLRRLVLGNKVCPVQGFFFRQKTDAQEYERISLMGNTKGDYELHLLFPDSNYPTPPSRDGELWVSWQTINREDEFAIPVRCP